MVVRRTYDINAAASHDSIEDSLDNYALNSSISDEIEIEERESPIELRDMAHTSGTVTAPPAIEKKQPGPPDGGWGWVVVLSAFLVSICIDGLGFSFGLLREEITKDLNAKQMTISLVGSLFIALPLLTGPVMSALVDRYGCKYTTMIAGILSTIGFLLSSICKSGRLLSLTYSLMGGLAMGILYVTSIVSITMWFDRRRNLALSLASSGFGIGPIIFSNMISYLLYNFDLSYTFLILAGTLLNMCVCGALMRDPDWFKRKPKKVNVLPKDTVNKSVCSSSSSLSVSKETRSDANISEENLTEGNTDSAILSVQTKPKKAKTITESKPKDEDKNKDKVPNSTDSNPQGADEKNSTKHNRCMEILSDHSYLKAATLHKKMLVHRGAMTSIPKYRLYRIERHDVYNHSIWTLDIHKDGLSRLLLLWMTPETMIDSKYLINIRFILFNVCSFGTYACSIIPYFFLNSLMSEKKVTGEDTVICVIGLGSIIGMVFFGWAGDQGWMNVTVAHAICLIVNGVSVVVYPLIITNFGLLIFLSLVFGITFASSYAFTPSIVMEMMPVDKFTTAYGIVLLSQGLGHLIGPPIGGMIYDSRDMWDITFYVAGVGLIASGVCAGAVAFIKDPRKSVINNA